MCGFEAAALAMAAAQAIVDGRNQSEMAERQATHAQHQAAFQRQAAMLEERQKRRANSATAATQRARFAASGIDPAMGSALLGQQDLAAQAALDELTARAMGNARARDSEHEAAVQRMRAAHARTDALFGAGTRLLRLGPYILDEF